jgi:hypothetical protein
LSVLLSIMVSPANAGSIFDEKRFPGAIDSGWAQCAEPVKWFADFGSLNKKQKIREQKNLAGAFQQWSKVTGLSFSYGGETTFRFNDSNNRLYSMDEETIPTRKTIFVSFVPQKESSLLNNKIYGFGGPTLVLLSKKEIVHGNIVIKTEHAKKYSGKNATMLRSLYLHELGHVLGLAHNETHKRHIMHPEVKDVVKFRKEVVSEISRLMKPC